MCFPFDALEVVLNYVTKYPEMNYNKHVCIRDHVSHQPEPLWVWLIVGSFLDCPVDALRAIVNFLQQKQDYNKHISLQLQKLEDWLDSQ